MLIKRSLYQTERYALLGAVVHGWSWVTLAGCTCVYSSVHFIWKQYLTFLANTSSNEQVRSNICWGYITINFVITKISFLDFFHWKFTVFTRLLLDMMVTVVMPYGLTTVISCVLGFENRFYTILNLLSINFWIRLNERHIYTYIFCINKIKNVFICLLLPIMNLLYSAPMYLYP